MYITKLIDETDYQAGSIDPGIEIATNEPLELTVGDDIIDHGNKYTIRRRVKKIVNNDEEIYFTADITSI